MTAVGGSIQDISIRGRLFPVTADADSNLKRGGFEADVQANGDGSARKILTRVPWMMDGLVVEIDHDRADLEYLQDRANEPDFVDISITYASGVTWQGTGTVTGELQFSSQNSSATLSLMGPNIATQQ